MAKPKKLSALISQELEKSSEVPEIVNSELTESLTPEDTESITTKQPDLQTNRAVSESETSALPKYLTLVRKETRLREEQIDALTALARKLNRQKQGGGTPEKTRSERITENTLIRVAVDLLLARSESLNGDSEAALRDSLSL